MHSYTRHLGDYAKDTRHLTLLEHGAYNVLMDWCYASERALPNDEAMLYRICAAFTKPEQQAVMSVITQFFQEQSEGWVQKRIEQELMKAHEKRGKAKDAALLRWNADAMRTHSDGNANAMRMHSDGNADAMPRVRALRNPVSLSLSIPPNPRQRGKSGKLTEPLFSDDVPEPYKAPLSDWFTYKQEKRQPYTLSGWQALVQQQMAFPVEMVARSVQTSMASNYQGLFTEKLTDSPTQGHGWNGQKKEGGAAGVKSWAARRAEADQAQEDELATLPQLPREDLPPEWDWQGVADHLYGASWDNWSDVPEDARRELALEWAKKEGGAQP
jgi:uncharacterized protein YdaU (DUF1376 family)